MGLTTLLAVPCHCYRWLSRFHEWSTWNPFHVLMGMMLLPDRCPYQLSNLHQVAEDHPDYEYVRVNLTHPHLNIGAVAIKRRGSSSRRWTLFALGRGGSISKKIQSEETYNLSDHLDSHVLLIDYPGVGISAGWPTVGNAIRSYQTALEWIENQPEVREIISYGHSLGGSFHLRGLSQHTLKAHCSYRIVTSRSYHELATVVGRKTHDLLGHLVRFSSWRLCVKSEVRQLRERGVQHLILTTSDNDQIALHDGIIHREDTLAYFVIKLPSNTIQVLLIPETHDEPIGAITAYKISQVIQVSFHQ